MPSATGAVSAGLQVFGLDRLFDAMNGLIEAARAEDDWWVGSIVVYSAHLEFGTRFMSARPYFQPAVLEVGRELAGATPRTISGTYSGRSLWGIMVGDEDGLAAKAAKMLERKTKEKIKEKGLIDTGHLRNSFVAVPSLPRLRLESYRSMRPQARSDETGELVSRDEIVDR